MSKSTTDLTKLSPPTTDHRRVNREAAEAARIQIERHIARYETLVQRDGIWRDTPPSIEPVKKRV